MSKADDVSVFIFHGEGNLTTETLEVQAFAVCRDWRRRSKNRTARDAWTDGSALEVDGIFEAVVTTALSSADIGRHGYRSS